MSTREHEEDTTHNSTTRLYHRSSKKGYLVGDVKDVLEDERFSVWKQAQENQTRTTI
jgi:hypothetical protein